uniref:(California timema) hypothetical protein n=1 Tax=Timema californicum TaxID=61474 RepID=A0A7R9P7Z9_TIMCA|nr:unnamed protein product [Timema californicum]
MILLHYDVLTVALLTITSVQAFRSSNQSDASRRTLRKFDLTQSSANFYRINDAVDGPNVNNIETYFYGLENTHPNSVNYLLKQDEAEFSQKETITYETTEYRLPTSVVPDRYVITLIPNLDDGNFTFVGTVEITLNVTNATNSITETITYETTEYRLPTSVVPDRYVITLIPNLDDGNFTFVGTVEITLNVTNATNSITVHANDLEIDNESVSVHSLTDEVDLVVLGLSPDARRHFFTVTLADSLVVGQQYRLRINYTGHLREDMGGFYRSYYYVGTEKRWLASTQFQPTSARRAFPCFDEPGLKAIFKVSIGVDSRRHALANMPVESIDLDAESVIVWHHFQEYPHANIDLPNSIRRVRLH